jgi:hypothetical protein
VEYWLERTQEGIRAYGSAQERPRMRAALVDYPTFLLPIGWGDALFNPERPPAIPMYGMRLAGMRGDADSLREDFASIDRMLSVTAPWSFPPEFSVLANRLRLIQGDTASAIRILDLQLKALPALHRDFLAELPPAGALVRLMLLRMEIAEQQGDLTTARRWARAATTLWAEAEPGMQPFLTDARRLAQ